jgi:hypothetical protein
MSSVKKFTLRQVFIRIYRQDILYIQSCWFFRPRFVNYCPSNLLSGSSLPPYTPFPVLISIQYTRIQCVKGWVYGVLGGRGLRQINACRKVPLQVNFVRWRHFALVSVQLNSPWSCASGPARAHCASARVEEVKSEGGGGGDGGCYSIYISLCPVILLSCELDCESSCIFVGSR